MLKIKRVYEKKEASDGKRLLLDRLWPRGLTKEAAAIDEWNKDLAPSDALRKWFGHEDEKWSEFRRRYIEELSNAEREALLRRIAAMAKEEDVTIVYSAKDAEHNNAVVLQEVISKMMAAKAR